MENVQELPTFRGGTFSPIFLCKSLVQVHPLIDRKQWQSTDSVERCNRHPPWRMGNFAVSLNTLCQTHCGGMAKEPALQTLLGRRQLQSSSSPEIQQAHSTIALWIPRTLESLSECHFSWCSNYPHHTHTMQQQCLVYYISGFFHF